MNLLQNLAMVGVGAALVCLGVVAGAWADRIRGYRAGVALPAPRARASRREANAASSAPIEVETPAISEMGRDVIAALAGMGIGKAAAEAAALAVPSSARGTLDSWLRAALRQTGPAVQS